MQANKITKYDLVESVYQNTKFEKHVIQDVVENLFEQIKQSLKPVCARVALRLAIRVQENNFLLLLIMLQPSVQAKS